MIDEAELQKRELMEEKRSDIYIGTITQKWTRV